LQLHAAYSFTEDEALNDRQYWTAWNDVQRTDEALNDKLPKKAQRCWRYWSRRIDAIAAQCSLLEEQLRDSSHCCAARQGGLYGPWKQDVVEIRPREGRAAALRRPDVSAQHRTTARLRR
jgi:hypothetical protein